jgi:replicative DNA helicase
MSDTEAKVLAAVLRDKQVHVLMQANVGALLTTHTDVWEFIRNYVDKNGSVPPENIVVENFRDFSPPESVGTTKHHLEQLQAEFMDQRVREILRNAATQVQDGNSSDAVNTLISQTSDLKKVTTSVKDVDLVDVDAAVAHFETVQKMNALGSYGIKTGLPGFDAVLPSGITGGMLGVFLAYPGIGKSWLAMYFAAQAWKQGKVPLIISLEMSEAEVRNRLFTVLGDGIWSLRKMGMGEVELDMFKKWHAKVFTDKPPFYIVSSDNDGEVNPSVVKAKIDQYKPDFVVLDYLQLMSPNTKTDNEVTKMKNLSRELKQLARGSDVPILAISSATPDDVTNLSQPPTLGQTAWSRQIAYDADWLVALGRDPNSDVVTAVYRKNRHGPMNEFYVQCDFNHGRFIYVDDPDN